MVCMNNGQLIPYVEKCIHLGIILTSISKEQTMTISSIIDLNVKTNNVLSEFSFSESTTLSRLFSSYCMNVYGSSLWRYNNHNNLERFCISWQKSIRKLWKIPSITHNALVHLINNCNTIVNILEKRCANFLWSCSIVIMYSLPEFVDIVFAIVTPLLVKIYDISCTSIICYIVTGMVI